MAVNELSCRPNWRISQCPKITYQFSYSFVCSTCYRGFIVGLDNVVWMYGLRILSNGRLL
jgi:hypothetical protein